MPRKRTSEDKDCCLEWKKTRYQMNITYFPNEVTVKIFQYLTLNELLLKVALVCEDWNKLTKAPALWNHMDLSHFPKVTTETVKKLLKYSYGIYYIDLTDCIHFEESVISEIANQETLEELSLKCCHQIPPDSIKLLSKCRNLASLNLQELKITDEALITIANSCKDLMILNVSGCSEVSTIGLQSVIQNCTDIEFLNLGYCTKVTDDFLMALVAAELYSLHVLYIHNCNFTAKGLKHLRKLPEIRRLDIGCISDVNNALVSMLSKLQYLGLQDCEAVDNDGVLSIVKNNQSLYNICLSGCTIDDAALEIIAKSSCRLTLETLFILDCPVSGTGI